MSKKSKLAQSGVAQDTAIAKRAQTDTLDKFYLKVTEGPDAGKVYVDPAKAYPRYLGELGIEPKAVDQYWLEVARLLMTEDLAGALGKPLHLVILKREEFALRNFPQGKGEAAAKADAAEHYKRLMQIRAIAAI